MIAFQIKRIVKNTPIRPGNSADRHKAGEMQEFVGSGGISDRGEKGIAVLQVNALGEADLNELESVLILGDFPIRAKCIGHEKTIPGDITLELYFDQIFNEGFNASIEDFLSGGMGIVALSASESASIGAVATQTKLFHLMVDLLFPDKKEAIKKLVLPCFILHGLENEESNSSCFMGDPLFPADQKVPKNKKNKALFHLATLRAEQINAMFGQYSKFDLLTHLSFYIDIANTERGWPQEADRFKVLNYSEPKTGKSRSEYSEPAYKIVFEEGMDIPKYDHSILHQIGLSEEERDRYDRLYEAFMEFCEREYDEEKNKFFGYPDNVQHCVAYEAERLKTKKDFSDDIYLPASEWQLLLQLSPYAQEFSFFEDFGDGAIYFMIRKKDLDAGNFDDVQVVVQNT